jgi:hypothetical protein
VESINLVGMHDPQLTGTMQDDPLPATEETPSFWRAQGGWQHPDNVGQPLVAQLAPEVLIPPILFAARDNSHYEIAIQRMGQDLYTTLEGELWPGQTPTVTSLSPDKVTLGGSNVTMKVLGSGFGPGSVICLDGEPVVTMLTQVLALATELQVEGATEATSRTVTVRNPDGAESGSLTLSVEGSAEGSERRPVGARPSQEPGPPTGDPGMQTPPPHRETTFPETGEEDPNVKAPPPHHEGVRPEHPLPDTAPRPGDPPAEVVNPIPPAGSQPQEPPSGGRRGRRGQEGAPDTE